VSRRLEGKVAIVTGAGTGIGEAVAHKFAKGVSNCQHLMTRLRTWRNRLSSMAAKQTSTQVISRVPRSIQRIPDTYGQLDILVNNAGVSWLLTQGLPVEVFDDTIRMNLRSAFLMTKYAPHLQNSTATSSQPVQRQMDWRNRHGGTKGWMHSFMGVAVEQASTVSAPTVRPIDTAWTHKETGPMDGKDVDPSYPWLTRHHRGVANVYAFIASPNKLRHGRTLVS